MTTRKLPLILLLMATIVFISVAPVKSQALPPTLDLTASPPCVCSTSAIYKIHIENPPNGIDTGIQLIIPDGYTVNPAYMTSTAGITIATGFYGTVNPFTSPPGDTIALITTGTPGIFQIIDAGIPGPNTGLLTPPTENTAGIWVILPSPEVNPNLWVDITFISGFFTNPCTAESFNWSAQYWVGARWTTIDPRPGYSNAITITVCSPVGGVVTPTNKTEILAPYLALAGLIVAVSAVVLVKKRRD